MGTQAPSVYQQVIEKTKGIMSRTQELARNIEKKLNVDKMGYDGVRATHNILTLLFDCTFIYGLFFFVLLCFCFVLFLELFFIMGGTLVNIQIKVVQFFVVKFPLLL